MEHRNGDFRSAIADFRAIPYGRLKYWLGMSLGLTLAVLAYLCFAHRFDGSLTQADYLIYTFGGLIVSLFVGWVIYFIKLMLFGDADLDDVWPFRFIRAQKYRNRIGFVLLVQRWNNGDFLWFIVNRRALFNSKGVFKPFSVTHDFKRVHFSHRNGEVIQSSTESRDMIVATLAVPLGGPNMTSRCHMPHVKTQMFYAIADVKIGNPIQLFQISVQLKTTLGDLFWLNVEEALNLMAERKADLPMQDVGSFISESRNTIQDLHASVAAGAKVIDEQKVEIDRLKRIEIQRRSLRAYLDEALTICRASTRITSTKHREGLRVYNRVINAVLRDVQYELKSSEATPEDLATLDAMIEERNATHERLKKLEMQAVKGKTRKKEKKKAAAVKADALAREAALAIGEAVTG